MTTAKASKKSWKRRILCDFLGWHGNVRTTGFDGCSIHGLCGLCKGKVMQDSWGGWFGKPPKEVSGGPELRIVVDNTKRM